MSAPVVTAVSPVNAQTDVVLGIQIVVTFDQAIDISTVTDGTFSLTGPGQTQILTPDQMIAADPTVLTGREYITGTYVFSNGNKTVTFNPAKPLRPNLTYNILLLGVDGQISSDGIKSQAGEGMATSYQWSFTTGDLNLSVPPIQSPTANLTPRLDPKSIKIVPRPVVNNDLTQEIDLIFPDNVDPSSFNMDDLLVSIDPMLGDLDVPIPTGLTAVAAVDGKRIRITITGW